MPVPVISRIPLGESLQQTLFVEDSMVAIPDSISASPVTLLRLWVDVSQAGFDFYIKLWNKAASDISVGTSSPDAIVYCPIAGSGLTSLEFSQDGKPGLFFNVALSAACVQSAGTGGTTGPAANVRVIIAYSKVGA
jgi:hypothetical protein